MTPKYLAVAETKQIKHTSAGSKKGVLVGVTVGIVSGVEAVADTTITRALHLRIGVRMLFSLVRECEDVPTPS